METWLALVLAAVAFGGFIANALRLNTIEAKLKILTEKKPEPEAVGSYRVAPPRPAEEDSPPKAEPKQEPPKKGPGRPFVPKQGKLDNCPICEGFVHVGNPTFFPAGCNDPACETTAAHLHQNCGCGATWASYAKPVKA